MRSDTEPWWRQAQADLETARTNLDGQRYYAASWFAQQASEKALKALYIERFGAMAPYTHDLEYLGDELEAPDDIKAELSVLNPIFSLVRYPDVTGGRRAPVDEVTEEQALDHISKAQRVLEWVNDQLSTEEH